MPVPVPGDFLMLLAGVRAATGAYTLWEVIVALMAAALLAGGTQYLLARGPSRRFVYRFGRYVGLTPPRLDKAANAVRKRGPTAVAVGTVTPGLSMVTYIACGLAGLGCPAVRHRSGHRQRVVHWPAYRPGLHPGPSALTLLDNIHVPIVPVITHGAPRPRRLAGAHRAPAPPRRPAAVGHLARPARLDRDGMPVCRSWSPQPGGTIAAGQADTGRARMRPPHSFMRGNVLYLNSAGPGGVYFPHNNIFSVV